jgi:hypothetical protein
MTTVKARIFAASWVIDAELIDEQGNDEPAVIAWISSANLFRWNPDYRPSSAVKRAALEQEIRAAIKGEKGATLDLP